MNATGMVTGYPGNSMVQTDAMNAAGMNASYNRPAGSYTDDAEQSSTRGSDIDTGADEFEEYEDDDAGKKDKSSKKTKTKDYRALLVFVQFRLSL